MLPRLLTLVLVLAGFGMVSPAAEAAGSLTLTAGSATLDAGASAIFRGKAPGSAAGTVVRLQRRVDGRWKSVARTILGATRAFTFTVTPPRGTQRYRAFRSGQPGQAAATSTSVTLTVRWKPQVDGSAEYFLDSRNVSVTRVSLSAPALGGASLVEQRRAPGTTTWVSTGRAVALDSQGAARASIRVAARGTDYRYVAPASGARRLSASPVVTVRLTPVPLTVDDPHGVTLHDLGDGITATVVLEATAGQRIGLAVDHVLPEGAGSELGFHAFAPDGSPMTGFDSNRPNGYHRTITWVAPQTGEYRLDVQSFVNDSHPVLDAATVWASTPKVVDVTREMLRAPAQFPVPPLAADRPGQSVEVHYPAEAGELISVGDRYDGYCAQQRSFLDSDGAVVTPWFERLVYTEAMIRGVVAPAAGTQVYRVTPCDNLALDGAFVTLRSPSDVVTATVDGGGVVVRTPDYDTVSVVHFDAVAGDRVDIAYCPCRVFAPDGLPIVGVENVYDLPQTGRYTIAVHDGGSGSVEGVEITTHRGK